MKLTIDQPFDLSSSLESGQSHRWVKSDSWYIGVVLGNLVKIRQIEDKIEWHSAPSSEEDILPLLKDYFRLDDDLNKIYEEITQDDRVSEMVAKFPGLRLLRQDPWECTIAFICSANSNIPRIHRVIENLSNTFGTQLELDGHIRHSFPSPQELVVAGEQKLRELGLGFRAPYVDKATQLVNANQLDLQSLIQMPYELAKKCLMECPGIGPKIADCILVFSLEKMEAFPIDVWVRRALGDWYFPNQKTPSNQILQSWAQNYFGSYGGYAQQYLFHGRRLQK
ncbi:MAG: 8-oxoguanine DNA glycosylase [Dehalococcoidia bacterium]|nr:8-oxoguanine DNA glycosylase [Dehalococcoidia bacterium]